MTCRSTRALMSGYVKGELDADGRAALLEHLSRCPRCAQALQEQRAALLALQRLPASAPSVRVTAAVLAADGGWLSRRAALSRVAGGVALAGAGVLTAVAVARLGRRARIDTTAAPAASAAAGCPARGSSGVQGIAAAAPPPNGHALAAGVPPGFFKTAENASLALYVANTSGQVAVQDKRHGLVWLSNPWRAGQQTVETGRPPADGERAGGIQEPPITATVFFLSYVTAEDPTSIEIFPSGWEQSPRRVTRLPDGGMRVAFTLRRPQVSLVMDYRLGPDYVDVTIPQDQFVPWSDPSRQSPLYVPPAPTYAYSVEPLPFFGAASNDERGVLLLPGGCTAPLPFALPAGATPNPATYRPPSDPRPATSSFGLAEEVTSNGGTLKGAFVGVVTQGMADAAVQAVPGSDAVPYVRVGAVFAYRRTAARQVGPGKSLQAVQPTLIAGDRVIRYLLLGASEATAAGMLAAAGRLSGRR